MCHLTRFKGGGQRRHGERVARQNCIAVRTPDETYDLPSAPLRHQTHPLLLAARSQADSRYVQRRANDCEHPLTLATTRSHALDIRRDLGCGCVEE